MKIHTRTYDGVLIVSVSGIVDSHAAGALMDALVDCIGKGSTQLIVDLSGVHIMTRAGVRGLIVAAKLMQSAQGRMRLCSALRSVEDCLQNLAYGYLLNCDPTLTSSLAELTGREGGRAPAPCFAPVYAAAL